MISVDAVLPQDDLTFSCLRQDELISRWFCSKNPRSAVTLSSERLVPLSQPSLPARSRRSQESGLVILLTCVISLLTLLVLCH